MPSESAKILDLQKVMLERDRKKDEKIRELVQTYFSIGPEFRPCVMVCPYCLAVRNSVVARPGCRECRREMISFAEFLDTHYAEKHVLDSTNLPVVPA